MPCLSDKRPTQVLADAEALAGLDLAEITITSVAHIVTGPAPAGAFKLDDVQGAAVVVEKAQGSKCARCWRILAEVGKSAAHPRLCMRCEAAVKEHDARL